MKYNSEQNLSDIKYEPLCFHKIFGYQQSSDSPTIQSITIPKMQRDFAYGRSEGKVPQKRKNFLESLKKAINGDPITLDFIYGFTNELGCMTPLDGQQRLTILFLLYYYAACKSVCKSSKDISEIANYLTRFEYDTRVSARQFCENLTRFNPFVVEVISDVEKKSLTEGMILPDELADVASEKSTETPEEKETELLSDIIKNQKWFLAEWIKDPTVEGMLTMLDDIDNIFGNIENIWEALMDEKICFYFMPLDDTGLTDDLYIKINSRGKDLTDFENFKAELSNVLSLVDEQLAKTLLNKIDIQWTRKIWKYRNADKETVIDPLLLRYFKYLASIILCEQGIFQEPEDEWAVIRDLFESNIPNEDDLEEDEVARRKNLRSKTISDNAQKIIKYTDCWQNLDVNDPGFGLMLDCCRSFSLRGDRGFPSEKVVRLYAFICYYSNKNTMGYSWLTDTEFNRRMRMLDHLLTFSYDALSHRERMPILIEQTRQLILIEDVSKSLDSRSNGFQVRVQEEELLKYQGLANGELRSLQSVVFKLEDHPVFNGFIGLVGYENVVNKPEIVDRFYNLLPIDNKGKIAAEKLELLARFILSVNQKAFYEESKRVSKYPCCNLSSWQDLAAPQRKVGETHELTSALLSILGSDFSKPDINQKINSVLAEVENSSKRYDFTYYYMKYSEFLDPEAYLLVNYRRAVQGRFSRIYNWEIDPNHDRSQTDAYELVDNCYVIPTTVTLGGLNLDVHLLVIKQLLQIKGWQNLAPNEYAYQSYYSHGYCELGLSHGYELRNYPKKVTLVKKDDENETECWSHDIPQKDNCDSVDRIIFIIDKLMNGN